jgi:hypothetical protein
MTIAAGGADKERRDRRFTNEANRVAGRCLGGWELLDESGRQTRLDTER